MFWEDGIVKIVSVDINYLRTLYNADNEVQYSPLGYENKKFVGLLINNESSKYIIPLSSAKEKHKRYKNKGMSYLLIYEIVPITMINSDSIYVFTGDKDDDGVSLVKHIMALLDCKKMIPVIDGVYFEEKVESELGDSIEVVKYKELLTKELLFCSSNLENILVRANKIYIDQITSGIINNRCCNFALLEETAKKYELALKNNKNKK